MFVVFGFVVQGLRMRLRMEHHWQIYGPLYCVSVAIPLIVADLWRHVLQDETLRLGDLLGMLLFVASAGLAVSTRMVFLKQPWGPWTPPKNKAAQSAYFQHAPMFVFLLGLLLIYMSHQLDGGLGTTLSWPECGDNEYFGRVNQTWSSSCTWSSSQYKCEYYCCVPGGDNSIPMPQPLPGGVCNCDHCIDNAKENMAHLSPMGILFTMTFTYLGFALLAVGTLWNANIISKLKEVRTQWRQLRNIQDEDGAKPAYDPLPEAAINVAPSWDDAGPCDQTETDEHRYQYDVVVVGGGSGGLACSKACQQLGKRTAVLDFVQPSPVGTTWGLGGTCVNVGCIPKKLMHQAGIVGEVVGSSASYGWKETEKSHSWTALRDNVQDYIKSLNFGYRTELAAKGVTYINGFGRFKNAHTIEVTTAKGDVQVITARRFVLAMGGRPTYPEFPGAKEHCITSDDLFQLRTDPGKVCVVGASYVALECAGFLNALGKSTTVMIRSIPLRGFDQQMAGMIVEHMRAHGTRFLEKAVPTKVELLPSGKKRVHFTSESGPGAEEFDTVLLATGRLPETVSIGLQGVGVELARSGKVRVDRWDRTSIPHIYAIGDIVEGGLELTPVAIQAGRLLAARLFNGATKPMDYVNVPTTVFTPLEYGCCGYSEEDAATKFGQDNIEVYHSGFTPLEWRLPHWEENVCYVKLICLIPENEKVIGFHILTPNAGEITQGVAAAMKSGVTKAVLDDTIGIHPTVAEEFTTLSVTKRSGQTADKGGC